MENPYELIKNAGLDKTGLGAEGNKVLTLYEDAIKMKQKYPDNKTLQETAETTITKVNQAIKKLIAHTLQQNKSEADKEKEKTTKKEKSKKAMEAVEYDKEELAECDRRLKAARKAEREKSGKKPVKKTRRTKLKERALSIIRLTPPELVGDIQVMKANRKIVRMIISECMGNWKMNQVKQTQDSVMKELDKMEEKVTKDKPEEKSTAPKGDYLSETVKALKKSGIEVTLVEEQTDTTDASIELDEKFHVQVIDHSSGPPTFILNEELDDGETFRHSDELLSIEALIKEIKMKMKK